jgi:hypothetical protein
MAIAQAAPSLQLIQPSRDQGRPRHTRKIWLLVQHCAKSPYTIASGQIWQVILISWPNETNGGGGTGVQIIQFLWIIIFALHEMFVACV